MPAPSVHASITNALVKNNEFSMDKLFAERESSLNRNSFTSRRL
jgi:hypothetical protein